MNILQVQHYYANLYGLEAEVSTNPILKRHYTFLAGYWLNLAREALTPASALQAA